MSFSGTTYDAEQGSSRAGDRRAQQKALHRVEIVPIQRTENGQHYRVTYAGRTLVEGRRNPVFDACRVLLARGITGRLEVWRPGKTSADMQLDIEQGALSAIRETDKKSLQLVPWHPWWRSDDVSSPDGVLYAGVESPAAAATNSVPKPTQTETAALGHTVRVFSILLGITLAAVSVPGVQARLCAGRSIAAATFESSPPSTRTATRPWLSLGSLGQSNETALRGSRETFTCLR